MEILEAAVYKAMERVDDSWLYDETTEAIYALKDACTAYITEYELQQQQQQEK